MLSLIQTKVWKWKRAELEANVCADDIFLPSDEAGRSESDDFDHEIEEFKRLLFTLTVVSLFLSQYIALLLLMWSSDCSYHSFLL